MIAFTETEKEIVAEGLAMLRQRCRVLLTDASESHARALTEKINASFEIESRVMDEEED